MEGSVCLSKGQVKGYLERTLFPEELRAVELHISECSFCSDAIDGYTESPDGFSVGLAMPLLPPPSPKEKDKPQKDKKAPAQEAPAPLIKDMDKKRAPQPEPLPATAPKQRPLSPKRPTSKRGPGWAMAAGILVLIGCCVGYYYYMDDRQDNAPLAFSDDQEPFMGDSVHEPALGAQNEAKPLPQEQTENAPAPAHVARQDTLPAHEKEPVQAKSSNVALTTNAAPPTTETLSAPAAQAATPMAAAAKNESSDSYKNTERKESVAVERPDKELSDYEMGIELFKQKQYASALLYLRAAESDPSNPNHWDAVYYSALCNKNLNKGRKARKLLEKIVESDAPQKKAALKQLEELKNKD